MKKQYTGYTAEFPKRLSEHNSGKTESTKRRRPFVIIDTELCEFKEEAERREKYQKSGKGR